MELCVRLNIVEKFVFVNFIVWFVVFFIVMVFGLLIL